VILCGCYADASQEFIDSLKKCKQWSQYVIEQWTVYVLLSVMKTRTLHIRMKQHSHNASIWQNALKKDGLKTVYPGLKVTQSHELYSLINHGVWFWE
jgi:methionine-gamma-lyase